MDMCNKDPGYDLTTEKKNDNQETKKAVNEGKLGKEEKGEETQYKERRPQSKERRAVKSEKERTG